MKTFALIASALALSVASIAPASAADVVKYTGFAASNKSTTTTTTSGSIFSPVVTTTTTRDPSVNTTTDNSIKGVNGDAFAKADNDGDISLNSEQNRTVSLGQRNLDISANGIGANASVNGKLEYVGGSSAFGGGIGGVAVPAVKGTALASSVGSVDVTSAQNGTFTFSGARTGEVSISAAAIGANAGVTAGTSIDACGTCQ